MVLLVNIATRDVRDSAIPMRIAFFSIVLATNPPIIALTTRLAEESVDQLYGLGALGIH